MDLEPKKRLEVVPNIDEDITCLTLILSDEDDTLGNALRCVLMKNPDVKFCGYTVIHPSEKKINLHIQTYSAPAAEVFKKSLEDLQKMCDIVTEKFKAAHQDYTEAKENEREESSMDC